MLPPLKLIPDNLVIAFASLVTPPAALLISTSRSASVNIMSTGPLPGVKKSSIPDAAAPRLETNVPPPNIARLPPSLASPVATLFDFLTKSSPTSSAIDNRVNTFVFTRSDHLVSLTRELIAEPAPNKRRPAPIPPSARATVPPLASIPMLPPASSGILNRVNTEYLTLSAQSVLVVIDAIPEPAPNTARPPPSAISATGTAAIAASCFAVNSSPIDNNVNTFCFVVSAQPPEPNFFNSASDIPATALPAPNAASPVANAIIAGWNAKSVAISLSPALSPILSKVRTLSLTPCAQLPAPNFSNSALDIPAMALPAAKKASPVPSRFMAGEKNARVAKPFIDISSPILNKVRTDFLTFSASMIPDDIKPATATIARIPAPAPIASLPNIPVNPLTFLPREPIRLLPLSFAEPAAVFNASGRLRSVWKTVILSFFSSAASPFLEFSFFSSLALVLTYTPMSSSTLSVTVSLIWTAPSSAFSELLLRVLMTLRRRFFCESLSLPEPFAGCISSAIYLPCPFLFCFNSVVLFFYVICK